MFKVFDYLSGKNIALLARNSKWSPGVGPYIFPSHETLTAFITLNGQWALSINRENTETKFEYQCLQMFVRLKLKNKKYQSNERTDV